MNATDLDHPDAQRAELRSAVSDVDEALSAVTPEARERLSLAWGRLVTLLALGPAPSVKPCPKCGRVGMRDATLCGYCWTKLTPAA